MNNVHDLGGERKRKQKKNKKNRGEKIDGVNQKKKKKRRMKNWWKQIGYSRIAIHRLRPANIIFSNGKHSIHNDVDLIWWKNDTSSAVQVPDFFAWLWLLLLFDVPAVGPPPSLALLFRRNDNIWKFDWLMVTMKTIHLTLAIMVSLYIDVHFLQKRWREKKKKNKMKRKKNHKEREYVRHKLI